MSDLAKIRAELSRERAGDPLLCGTAYGLVCAIESELQNVYQRFNNLNDNRIKDYNDLRSRLDQLSVTVGTKLRGQNSTIEQLKESLASRIKQIEARQKGYYEIEGPRLKKDILDVYEMLALRTKRIEVLEEIDLESFKGWLRSLKRKEPIPTDGFGKPEGGLESGDLVESTASRVCGIYSHTEHHPDGMRVYGWWKNCGYDWKSEDVILFILRPRLPDQKER